MFEESLISSNNIWALWAVLFSVGGFAIWAERTKLGAKLSAVVIAILGTFVLSNLSIIPSTSPVYDAVWTYLVPLAIPLLLFKANIRKIIKEAGPTLAAFLFGTIGTIAGTIIAFFLIPLGEEGWKIAGIFCSTYIGGSMNYVAASEALQLRSGDLLTAGVAADNLVMTIYFLLLFALPSIKFLQKRYPNVHEENSYSMESLADERSEDNPSLLDMSAGVAISFILCAVGFGLQNFIGVRGSAILVITAIVVLLATVFPKQIGAIKGGDKIGTLLMQVFFAAIGASANIGVVLKVGPVLFIFAGLILFVHLIVILSLGKVFKLDLAEIVIASNANMGGPTTAAAMAVGRRWNTLVIPAILCGTLGYAVATFIGVGVGYWLR
jgi:uncharacterized membrane protein